MLTVASPRFGVLCVVDPLNRVDNEPQQSLDLLTMVPLGDKLRLSFGSLLAYCGIAFVQFFVLDRMFGFIQRFKCLIVSRMPSCTTKNSANRVSKLERLP